MKKIFATALILAAYSPAYSMYPGEGQFFEETSRALEHIVVMFETNAILLDQIQNQIQTVMQLFEHEDKLRAQLAYNIIDDIRNSSLRITSKSELPTIQTDISHGLLNPLQMLLDEQVRLEKEFSQLRAYGTGLIENQQDSDNELPDPATKFLETLHQSEHDVIVLHHQLLEFIRVYEETISRLSHYKARALDSLRAIQHLINHSA